MLSWPDPEGRIEWLGKSLSGCIAEKGGGRPLPAVFAECWRTRCCRRSVFPAGLVAAGLGEHRLRELNDEINKLFREKKHWERRILELGGVDHAKRAAAISAEADGAELPGSGGYKYFGASKNLPGVRELFETSGARAKKRSRGEIHRRLTVDYYGWRDEDDQELLREEAEAEGRMRARAVAQWHAAKAAGVDPSSADPEGLEDAGSGTSASKRPRGAVTEDDLAAMRAEGAGGAAGGSAAPLPTEEEIRARLVAKRKALLLARYGPGSTGAPE